jgi:putative transposase
MPHSRNNGYYHFVWSTWDRTPLLTPDKEAHTHGLIRQQCRMLKADVLALNGMPDHVHLLVTLPTTVSIAEVMKAVKGASARALNDAYGTQTFAFKWQGGYNYDTICSTHMAAIVRYIERQKQHHAEGRLWPAWEMPEDNPPVPKEDSP